MRKHKKFPGTVIPDIEQQHTWIKQYSVNPIELGQLCDEFPALERSWQQFKIVYELCKVENETDRNFSKLAR
jgi:hypothetical protein